MAAIERRPPDLEEPGQSAAQAWSRSKPAKEALASALWRCLMIRRCHCRVAHGGETPSVCRAPGQAFSGWF